MGIKGSTLDKTTFLVNERNISFEPTEFAKVIPSNSLQNSLVLLIFLEKRAFSTKWLAHWIIVIFKHVYFRSQHFNFPLLHGSNYFCHTSHSIAIFSLNKFVKSGVIAKFFFRFVHESKLHSLNSSIPNINKYFTNFSVIVSSCR